MPVKPHEIATNHLCPYNLWDQFHTRYVSSYFIHTLRFLICTFIFWITGLQRQQCQNFFLSWDLPKLLLKLFTENQVETVLLLISASLKSVTFTIWVVFSSIHITCGSLYATKERVRSQIQIPNKKWSYIELCRAPTRKTRNELWELL